MFSGLDIEIVEIIKKRLETELEDKELPAQRREEVEAILYNIDVTLKERRSNVSQKDS